MKATKLVVRRGPEEVIINGVSLDKMIKDHQHYIYKDCDDWQKMRLRIIDEDLSRIDFDGLDLREAIFVESTLNESSFDHCNLSFANLSKIVGDSVNFRYTNLYNTVFTDSFINNGIFDNADIDRTKLNKTSCQNSSFIHSTIRHACFSEADLIKSTFKDSLCSHVDFSYCILDQSDFGYTNIQGSNFFDTNLHLVDFSYSEIESSSFYRALLIGANFKHSRIDYTTTFSEASVEEQSDEYTMAPVSIACPEEGSFIGFKVGLKYNNDDGFVDNVLIKLEIPADAKRSSCTSKKCRCDKVKVLDIIDISSNEHLKEAVSLYDRTFKYRTDETIQISDFDDNRWHECSYGIHFFLSKDDAIRYGKW